MNFKREINLYPNPCENSQSHWCKQEGKKIYVSESHVWLREHPEAIIRRLGSEAVKEFKLTTTQVRKPLQMTHHRGCALVYDGTSVYSRGRFPRPVPPLFALPETHLYSRLYYIPTPGLSEEYRIKDSHGKCHRTCHGNASTEEGSFPVHHKELYLQAEKRDSDIYKERKNGRMNKRVTVRARTHTEVRLGAMNAKGRHTVGYQKGGWSLPRRPKGNFFPSYLFTIPTNTHGRRTKAKKLWSDDFLSLKIS